MRARAPLRRAAASRAAQTRASATPPHPPLPRRSPDVVYPVRFYGSVSTVTGADGKERRVWSGGETVVAIAYDNPIPGYDTFNTINLRLFRAAPCREFDLASFNTGDVRAALAPLSLAAPAAARALPPRPPPPFPPAPPRAAAVHARH